MIQSRIRKDVHEYKPNDCKIRLNAITYSAPDLKLFSLQVRLELFFGKQIFIR